MDAVQLPSAYGQLSYRMTYNLVSMFTDLAILGLVDLNEVTPELLSMRKNHVEILHRINTVLAGRTDEEKQADADRINLALGNITEEEIAARNEKQEELSSIQGDATSIAQSLGLIIAYPRRPEDDVRTKIRRWRGIWASGSLRHERGSFRAKDAIRRNSALAGCQRRRRTATSQVTGGLSRQTQRGGRSGRHPTIRITGAPGSPGVA
ncbi:defense against restriction protein [Escherichia coli]|uniref:Defense against restriction protein n=1 Tax=Escherichia coli TaxID=562 RepID=A0AB38GU77_ECOLX|nr:hypothetical protein [Escherichia coli]STK59615.1 defense against restriction protein [Escherichia coli]